ncbi:MAG TPA: RidA family protein [Bryobacteraceae bacterium]|nr:RidA family protein [Bryobacteraceae bacterium]
MKLNHTISFLILAVAFCGTAVAQSGSPVKHIQSETSGIASAVWVGDTLYVSGQLPTPVTPADRGKGSAAVWGDTKTQATSVFGKIEALLKEQGLGMGDVVMMHVYMAGDPANGGKLDFAGMNAAFREYFGTKEQPNKPARSAMQVAALVVPGPLLEVEVIAVKPK